MKALKYLHTEYVNRAHDYCVTVEEYFIRDLSLGFAFYDNCEPRFHVFELCEPRTEQKSKTLEIELSPHIVNLVQDIFKQDQIREQKVSSLARDLQPTQAEVRSRENNYTEPVNQLER